MREILFRGKRTYDGKWLYGNLVIDCTGKPHIVNPEYFYEDGHHLMYYDDTDQPVFIDSITVGQYTGMKDKNGTKIFEGDIVTLDEYVKKTFDVDDGEVRYGWGGFYIKEFSSLNSLNVLASYDGILRGEVIGNIYDNPELLKEN